MFYVADDEKRIVDSRGRIVGFVRGEKFTPFEWNGTLIGRLNDDPYRQGLSPMELELVSETIQRNKIRRDGSDVEA